MKLILLPIYVLRFWYLEAPVLIFRYFMGLNKAFLNLSSLSLMIKTFFKPWKNEYRQGLVGFSIFMGIAFKTLFIIGDLFLFLGIILFEVIVFVSFLAWPIAAFIVPFI